jgi:hypothetical protein
LEIWVCRFNSKLITNCFHVSWLEPDVKTQVRHLLPL